MATTLNDLLNNPTFLGAVVTGMATQATSYAGSDAKRLRVNRCLLAIPTYLNAQATAALTPVGLAVLPTLDANGGWTQANVNAACETALVALAGDANINVVGITAKAQDPATVTMIGEYLMVQCVAMLLNPATQNPLRAWLKSTLASQATLQSAATVLAGPILSMGPLNIYGGDLTGVPSSEVLGAIDWLLQFWIQ